MRCKKRSKGSFPPLSFYSKIFLRHQSKKSLYKQLLLKLRVERGLKSFINSSLFKTILFYVKRGKMFIINIYIQTKKNHLICYITSDLRGLGVQIPDLSYLRKAVLAIKCSKLGSQHYSFFQSSIHSPNKYMKGLPLKRFPLYIYQDLKRNSKHL